MIPFTVLWLLATILLRLTPVMGAWVEVAKVALYSFATMYGWLYWNARIAGRYDKHLSTDG